MDAEDGEELRDVAIAEEHAGGDHDGREVTSVPSDADQDETKHAS